MNKLNWYFSLCLFSWLEIFVLVAAGVIHEGWFILVGIMSIMGLCLPDNTRGLRDEQTN